MPTRVRLPNGRKLMLSWYRPTVPKADPCWNARFKDLELTYRVALADKRRNAMR